MSTLALYFGVQIKQYTGAEFKHARCAEKERTDGRALGKGKGGTSRAATCQMTQSLWPLRMVNVPAPCSSQLLGVHEWDTLCETKGQTALGMQLRQHILREQLKEPKEYGRFRKRKVAPSRSPLPKWQMLGRVNTGQSSLNCKGCHQKAGSMNVECGGERSVRRNVSFKVWKSIYEYMVADRTDFKAQKRNGSDQRR